MNPRIIKIPVTSKNVFLSALVLLGLIGLIWGIVYRTNLNNNKAFHENMFGLDKTLSKSAKFTLDISRDTKMELAGRLEGHRKPLKPILYGAFDASKNVVNDFVDYIDSIKILLIDKAGNNNQEYDEGDFGEFGKPLGKLNRKIAAQVLVEGGMGEKLHQKIKATRIELISIYNQTLDDSTVQYITKLGVFEDEIFNKKKAFDHYLELKPKSIEEIKAVTGMNNWSEYRFKGLPLSAVLPILTKFQLDARQAQAIMAEELARLTFSRTCGGINKYFPIMNARSGYVVKGEKFESEIAIGAFSSDLVDNSTVTINGQEIQLNDEGRGTYTETTKSYGTKTIELKASVTNPQTGETMTGRSSFDYIVGERSASMNLKKMNTLYIGVDNPIEVSIPGYAPNKTWVKCNGGDCKIRGGNGQYIVNVSSEGPVEIKLSAKGFKKTFQLTAKKLPDPKIKWGDLVFGQSEVNLSEFQKQKCFEVYFDNFDFDIDCKVVSFQLIRTPLGLKPVKLLIQGEKLIEQGAQMISQAESGDGYVFTDILVKCPGDDKSRPLSGLVYFIK